MSSFIAVNQDRMISLKDSPAPELNWEPVEPEVKSWGEVSSAGALDRLKSV